MKLIEFLTKDELVELVKQLQEEVASLKKKYDELERDSNLEIYRLQDELKRR